MALKYRITPVTPYQQNCTLIWCSQTDEGALVDPGGDAQKLKLAVKEEGVKITQILLTHGHLDHVGAARELADFYGVPIVGAHKADAFWLDQLPQQSVRFGFPHCDALVPDAWLVDQQKIHVGLETLTTLHCPGHTPGHVVFVSQAAQFLIAGDVLFAGSIGRTDFPRGNHEELIASIRNQLFVFPESMVVLPGHGPRTTIGSERKNNPFVADKKFG
jgi:glyoxylase-like metal-dependent hydrolase (beta-lactamase superfamily II)